MLQPNRQYSNGSLYRFGFNGQEASNEIKGVGNSYTAEYWEYDPRLMRRWNVDPRPRISESIYSVFSNNPLVFRDTKGDTTKLYNSKGAYMGTDFSGNGQFVFISNKENDEKLKQWHDTNFKEINESSGKDRTEIFKGMGSVYDVNSINEFYSRNYGKGDITQICGKPLRNLYNIKINDKPATVKDVLDRLKAEGIGPEHKTSVDYSTSGILVVSKRIPYTDNDPQNVAPQNTPMIHDHPNSKEILKITFNYMVDAHKVKKQDPLLFEVRPYSPVDDVDMRLAKAIGLDNSVRNIVVEKNWIFFYNGDDWVRIKR